jgi:hypothetical protein
VFQGAFFGLSYYLTRAFGVWVEVHFGAVGAKLSLAASAQVPNLRRFWANATGEAVDAGPTDAHDEYMADLARETAAAAGKRAHDCENIARSLVGVALNLMRPEAAAADGALTADHAAAAAAAADINVYAVLPTTRFATVELEVTSDMSDQQQVDYALLCCERTVDGGRSLRKGLAQRVAFVVLARSAPSGPVSPEVLSAIPAHDCVKKMVQVPKTAGELVDAVKFGLVKGLTVGHLIATFLLHTGILASEVVTNFRQQGQGALTLSADIRASALQAASERLSRLDHGHTAHEIMMPVAPVHIYPSTGPAAMLEQDVIERLERQEIAAVNADSELLKSVMAVFVLLRLGLEDWTSGAKTSASAWALVFGSAPACLKFQSAVPALAEHVAAASAELAAIRVKHGDGSSVGDAASVLPALRLLVLERYNAAKVALTALAPDESAGAQAHAAFANQHAEVLAFLDKLVKPALRSPTSERVPKLTTAAATISMQRLLQLYKGAMGDLVSRHGKDKLLSDEDKQLIEYVKNDAVNSPGENRRWLLAKVLSRDSLAKVYADGWNPTSLHFTGKQLNIRTCRTHVAGGLPPAPVTYATFDGQKFTRDNIDTLGSVVIASKGPDWDAIEQDTWLQIGDVVFTLLVGRVVGPENTTGFVVQQRDLTPLLDRMFNAARAEHASSFAWLILGLREFDPSRFCCGLDPGNIFNFFLYTEKTPYNFFCFCRVGRRQRAVCSSNVSSIPTVERSSSPSCPVVDKQANGDRRCADGTRCGSRRCCASRACCISPRGKRRAFSRRCRQPVQPRRA